jgi:hypothetical protein
MCSFVTGFDLLIESQMAQIDADWELHQSLGKASRRTQLVPALSSLSAFRGFSFSAFQHFTNSSALREFGCGA